MTALTRPTVALAGSWGECVAEYGDAFAAGSGLPEHGRPATDEAACRALVDRARTYADPAAVLPTGRIRSDFFWITADDEVIGFLRLTHGLNASLREVGGHIGYSVRPSRRRQGHASRALALALGHARQLGLDRVLLTCDDDNVASARTIEGNGGVLEDVREGKRRYWIGLSGGTAAAG